MHVTERRCPHCAETIKRDARVCKHCGREIKESSAGLLLTIVGILAVVFAIGSVTKSCRAPESSTQKDVATAANATSSNASAMWVTAERIDRHTCPSKKCGVVGTFDFREPAAVAETKDGWARVSRYYDASCRSGRSEFVETGNAECVRANGILDGQFAEWVEAKNLSSTRPSDPAETALADEALVKDSDDFSRYRRAFAKAAQELIAEGECTASDFQEMGGFMKSQNQKSEPIYFTYCGGMSLANRIYVNAETGETFR